LSTDIYKMKSFNFIILFLAIPFLLQGQILGIQNISSNEDDIDPLENQLSLSVEVPSAIAFCFGEHHADVPVTVVNNHPPMEYNWESSGTIGSNLDALPAGDYQMTATNAIGEFVILNFEIYENPELRADVTSTPETSAANGTATVHPSGGTPPFTYHWNTTPVQSTPTAIELPTNSYTVILTDLNNCTLEMDINVEISTDILNVDESDLISIYPNPFKDIFEIDLTTDGGLTDKPAQLFIYDVFGNMLLNKNLLDSKNRIEIAGIPNGVYLLVLKYEDQFYSKQLIKS